MLPYLYASQDKNIFTLLSVEQAMHFARVHEDHFRAVTAEGLFSEQVNAIALVLVRFLDADESTLKKALHVEINVERFQKHPVLLHNVIYFRAKRSLNDDFVKALSLIRREEVSVENLEEIRSRFRQHAAWEQHIISLVHGLNNFTAGDDGTICQNRKTL